MNRLPTTHQMKKAILSAFMTLGIKGINVFPVMVECISVEMWSLMNISTFFPVKPPHHMSWSRKHIPHIALFCHYYTLMSLFLLPILLIKSVSLTSIINSHSQPIIQPIIVSIYSAQSHSHPLLQPTFVPTSYDKSHSAFNPLDISLSSSYSTEPITQQKNSCSLCLVIPRTSTILTTRSHSIQTRPKSGIFKPNAFRTIFIDLNIHEPIFVKQALNDL